MEALLTENLGSTPSSITVDGFWNVTLSQEILDTQQILGWW